MEIDMQKWRSEAPSNIALIKYMGKKDHETNLPANSSLSYTLTKLKTIVSLELTQEPQDVWRPLIDKITPASIDLSKDAQARYIKHLNFLKDLYKIKSSFIIRSNNNFPQSCGIASSASSFAALTKCALTALSDLTNSVRPSINEQANLSRYGSGSSCRSFFAPWVLWNEEGVQDINLPYPELHHEVVIINNQPKQISSSIAHKLIQTSPLYKDRNKRAENNLQILLTALNHQDWHLAYEVCWEEFQDMHNLFLTCNDSFSYFNQANKDILNKLQDFWRAEKDGPIITMDAGPNIHLLYRPDQLEIAEILKQRIFQGNFDVI